VSLSKKRHDDPPDPGGVSGFSRRPPFPPVRFCPASPDESRPGGTVGVSLRRRWSLLLSLVAPGRSAPLAINHDPSLTQIKSTRTKVFRSGHAKSGDAAPAALILVARHRAGLPA